jgi:ribonucleoside-diphosphate reductase alpha chain
VILDRDFFVAYSAGERQARDVYWTAVRGMLETGEPGFSVDYANRRESLRNACTEVVSDTDSDICNLGSLNLARFEDVEAFAKAVRLGTMFLLAGTVYSDVPYTQVEIVRERNRRLGLGLLGIHEWLVKRGKRYAPDDELGEWLAVWRDVSNATAAEYAAAWGLNVPVAVRAIAPTGTIGIVAETTTGAEPMFCVAYRRRYKGPDGHATHYQYVVDPVAKRLVDAGVDPHTLEDAYTLAADPERRVAFQAWLQGYVDNAISSTINLPPWGSELNSDLTVQPFGDMLLKYLPKLRGVTVYPDGARSGQPLVRVAYDTAVGKEGQVFYEGADVCDISGKGGTCGA